MRRLSHLPALHPYILSRDPKSVSGPRMSTRNQRPSSSPTAAHKKHPKFLSEASPAVNTANRYSSCHKRNLRSVLEPPPLRRPSYIQALHLPSPSLGLACCTFGSRHRGNLICSTRHIPVLAKAPMTWRLLGSMTTENAVTSNNLRFE